MTSNTQKHYNFALLVLSNSPETHTNTTCSSLICIISAHLLPYSTCLEIHTLPNRLSYVSFHSTFFLITRLDRSTNTAHSSRASSPLPLLLALNTHHMQAPEHHSHSLPSLPSPFSATGGAAPNATGGGQHQGVLHPIPPGAVQVGQVKLRPLRRAFPLRGEQAAGVAPREAAATARSSRHAGTVDALLPATATSCLLLNHSLSLSYVVFAVH